MYSAEDVASLKVFYHFFAVLDSSQGLEKVTILLSAEIPGSQEKPFQEHLLSPLVLEEDSSQILDYLLSETELGVSTGSSVEVGRTMNYRASAAHGWPGSFPLGSWKLTQS